MPIIKRWIYGDLVTERIPKIKYNSGTELLRMYKHFPSPEEVEKNIRPMISTNGIKRWPNGFCVTKVFFNTGEIWTKKTGKDYPRLSVPDGIKITKKGTWGSPNGWELESRTDETRDKLYAKLRAQGWILPKDYWMGPPELKPKTLKKGKTPAEVPPPNYAQQEEPEIWTPDWLREQK